MRFPFADSVGAFFFGFFFVAIATFHVGQRCGQTLAVLVVQQFRMRRRQRVQAGASGADGVEVDDAADHHATIRRTCSAAKGRPARARKPRRVSSAATARRDRPAARSVRASPMTACSASTSTSATPSAARAKP